jgi:predicted nucleic acid-binding protein
MSDLILFDTSVLVDALRTGRYQDRIDGVRGLVRTSVVVLSELWRGAVSAADRRFLLDLQKNCPILTPTTQNWLESGQVLAQIRAGTGIPREKLRDLHFDVLIALTARSHGAKLITANRADFELICRYRSFKLEVWS